MIEKTVLDFLSNNLDVEVVCERDGQKAPFVLIEKTASGRENRINRATLALQSYGTSLYETMLLNEEVKAVASNLPQLGNVSASKLVSDYNFTDTTTKEYRYQAIFDVYYSMEE